MHKGGEGVIEGGGANPRLPTKPTHVVEGRRGVVTDVVEGWEGRSPKLSYR